MMRIKELEEWGIYLLLILLGSTWRTVSDKDLTPLQRLSIWCGRVFAGGLIALLVRYGGISLGWSEEVRFFVAGMLAVAAPELLTAIVVIATEIKHDPFKMINKARKWLGK
ncbi:hypothetical protein [Vibrio scophthalmi]|uniref:Holin n=1 Tax=Vibrio scophthalmi LMG 19158 TaxID=870967 RepID=F9RLS9_9VIBR|nr:hypothetical protein [Vibrio scophthalmi]EGU38773.1 hypothetical protein VIS19158_01205 [Vibrio scophthalmi LMG 19158]